MKEDDTAPLRRSRRERKSNKKFLTDDSGGEDSDSGQSKPIKPPTASVTNRGRDLRPVHSKAGKSAVALTTLRDVDSGNNKPLRVATASAPVTIRDSEFEHTRSAKQAPGSARTSLQSRASSDKNSIEGSIVDDYDKHSCSIPLRKHGNAIEVSCNDESESQLVHSRSSYAEQGNFFNVCESPPIRSYIGDSLKKQHIAYSPHPVRDGFDLFLNHLEQFDPNCWEDPSAVLESLLADLQQIKYSYALHRAMRLKAGFQVGNLEPHNFNAFYHDARNDLLKSAISEKGCITIDGDLVPFQHPAAIDESMVNIVKQIPPEADELPHLLVDCCADSDEQTLTSRHSRVSKLEKKKHRSKLKKESRKSQSRVKTLGSECQKASFHDMPNTTRKYNNGINTSIPEHEKPICDEKVPLVDDRAPDTYASAGRSDIIADPPHKVTRPIQDLHDNRYTAKHVQRTQHTGYSGSDRRYHRQTAAGGSSRVFTTESSNTLGESVRFPKVNKTEERRLSQDNTDNRGKNDKCKQSQASGGIAHVGYRGPNLHFGYKSSTTTEPAVEHAIEAAVHHYRYGAFKNSSTNSSEEMQDLKVADLLCNDSDKPLDYECFGASPISDISQD